jgi:pteridine reductase
MTTARPRAVLVTGGAVRVGRAIVETLARSGWSVAFSFRSSAAAARELTAALAGAGLTAVAIAADLDERTERRKLVEAAVAALGGLDALVNSAAIFPRTPIERLDEDALAAALRTNLEAPLFLALAAAPHLRVRSGAIVNLADVYAATPLKHHLAYSVSKAALVAATRALAVELAPEVRVNAVAPGIALFPASYDAAKRTRLLERTLLRREAGGGEIAGAVRYLLEDAAAVTGQVLTVDGGQSLVL